MDNIHELVRQLEHDYVYGVTKQGEYVDFKQHDTIEKINAYLNSKHTSGETDSMDREKPFFNIVTAAVNIWFRATDTDRKNIRIKATKQQFYALAFVATILLHDWMKKTAFGRFLNDWGITLARYGSAVIKFIEKDGELYREVIPWDRMICDTIDFENNIKIEKLWLTPAQLKERDYDQEIVEKLLSETTTRKDLSGQSRDNLSGYIPIYEIHGKIGLNNLTDKKKDEKKYVQQIHVVTFSAKKDGEGFNDYTLYSGKEEKDPYFLTHLIKEDGRTLAIGAVEHLFEAQWMVNHTVKTIKDQLDLASKLIFQTADGNFVGQNVLSAIEHGDILIHAPNQPLTHIQNNSHDITSLQNFGTQWQLLAKEITSTPEAMRGDTMPSGTAYRQVALLQQEAHSLFEIMTENKGLYLEDMLRKFIIPHLKKKMNTTDEVSSILEDYQITEIDSMFVPNEAVKRANQRIKRNILNGKIVFPEEQAEIIGSERQAVQESLNRFGNQRFIKPSDISDKTWKQALKDFEWDVEIEITNEATDKQAVMDTLSSVFQTIAANPAVLQDQNAKLLFNKILNETSAVSPIELKQSNQSNQFAPALNQQNQQGQQAVLAGGGRGGLK